MERRAGYTWSSFCHDDRGSQSDAITMEQGTAKFSQSWRINSYHPIDRSCLQGCWQWIGSCICLVWARVSFDGEPCEYKQKKVF